MLGILEKLLLSIALTACSIRCVNFLQLGGYRLKAVFAYLKTLNFLLLVIVCALSVAVSFLLPDFLVPVMFVLLAAVFIFEKARPKKTPLKFTKRVWRLLAAEFVCFFGFAYLFYTYLPPMIPMVAAAALALTYPVEKIIGIHYITKAKRKLEKIDPVIIGITGSFGKTSVKNVLATILSQKFKVFATPKSFNTPLGIARAVNEADLSGVQVFIAEMGARRKYDIRALTKFVRPHHGIITGVAAAHLETFKTLENISAEKFRLAQNLRDGGFCVFSSNNKFTMQMFSQFQGAKLSAGLDGGAFVFADNIALSKEGCRFTLHIGTKAVECGTQLLGKHNIVNICLASALADTLGLSPEEITEGIARLQPVPHRLELVKAPGGLTILDDSYNANLEGIEASAEVLSLFEGKKAVIACGIVEGGKGQFELNVKAGEIFAGVCDYVILTGPNAEAIKLGLTNKNFNAENVFTEKNLAESVARANALFTGGGVLLFSNDLPAA